MTWREAWRIKQSAFWDCATLIYPHTAGSWEWKALYSIPHPARGSYRLQQGQVMVATDLEKQWNKKLAPHLRRRARIGTEHPWTATARTEDQIISQHPTSFHNKRSQRTETASGRGTQKAEWGQGRANSIGTGNSPLSLSESSTATGRRMPPRQLG